MRVDEKTLREWYEVRKETDAEIAVKLDCSKQLVGQLRKRYGIKTVQRFQRHDCCPTPRQLDILHGSLLGDGSITNGIKNGGKCQSLFECKHGPRQKDYLMWKYRQLSTLCVSGPKETSDRKWRIRTFHHEFFSSLRRLYYPEGVKTVPPSVFDNMTAEGLAVWFMDDGRNCCEGINVEFCTCSFGKRDHELLRGWLADKFSIETRVATYGGYPFLVVKPGYRMKLLNTIRPFVVPCMQYKLNDRRVKSAECP